MSARFVRFCGGQTICFVRLSSASCPRLLFAPRQVFTQLLRRTRLALGLLPLGPVAGSILPQGRLRFIRQIFVMIVHGRTHSRIYRFSTAPTGFCTVERRSLYLRLALVINLWQ